LILGSETINAIIGFGSPGVETGEYGSKDPESIKYNRQKSGRLTRDRTVMGTVVG
jgi:hypothetical protein